MSTFRYTKAKKLAILRNARALLDRPRGWTKGDFEDWAYEPDKGYPAYCSVGAVRSAAATLGFPFDLRVHNAISLEDFVKRETDFEHVVGFNDDKKTTKKAVPALFDGKIAELEAS